MPISIEAFNKFQTDLTVIDNPAKGEKGYVDEADTAVVRRAFDVFKIGDEIPYYSPPFKALRASFISTESTKPVVSHLTYDNLSEVASLAVIRQPMPIYGLHLDVKPHQLVAGGYFLVSITIDGEVSQCTEFLLDMNVTHEDGSGFYQLLEKSSLELHAGGFQVDTPLRVPAEWAGNTLVRFEGYLLPKGCVQQDSDKVDVKASYAPQARPQ